MKKNIKGISFFLAVWMVMLCFAGCSAKNTSYDTAPQVAEYRTESTTYADSGTKGAQTSAETFPTDDRKIILTAYVEMETLAFDDAVQALQQAVGEIGGYVAGASVSQYNGAARYAQYELRIPATQYTSFLQEADGIANVLHREESSEDITSQYVDVAARIKSLTLQQERLYALLESAGELETLLAIQTQLSEVQYQLERYASQQKTYDNLIDYATVNISLQEVQRITEQQDTFFQRLGASFTRGWYNFGTGLQDFAVWFVGAIPVLLVWAFILTVAYQVVRHLRKRRQSRLLQSTKISPPNTQES